MSFIGVVACGGSEKQAAEAEGPDIDVQGGNDDSGESKVELGDRGRTTRETRIPTLDDDDDDDDQPGVSVKGLKGRLEPYDIRNGIQPHAGALSGCYSQNLKRRKYIGGDITFRFRVDTKGNVKTAQLVKSDLGAWDIERCMLDVARTMTFAPPRGGEAEFTLPLEFDATRSASWLEEEVGIAQVKELRKELKPCARQAKTRRPRNVTVTLYVGARGAVTSVGFASPAKRPIADAWADCAETVVRAWVLPDPLGRIAKIAFRWK